MKPNCAHRYLGPNIARIRMLELLATHHTVQTRHGFSVCVSTGRIRSAESDLPVLASLMLVRVLLLWLTASTITDAYMFHQCAVVVVDCSCRCVGRWIQRNQYHPRCMIMHGSIRPPGSTRGSCDMMDSVIGHECLHRHDIRSIGCWFKLLELDRVVLCDTSKKLQSGNGEHVCMTCVHVHVHVNPIDDYGLVGSTRACASRCPCSSHSPRWPHVMLLLVLLPARCC
jgi:hypothetical protein